MSFVAVALQGKKAKADLQWSFEVVKNTMQMHMHAAKEDQGARAASQAGAGNPLTVPCTLPYPVTTHSLYMQL